MPNQVINYDVTEKVKHKKLARPEFKKTDSQSKSKHADHSAELKRLVRIKGQVEGIKGMIIDKRYCPEIVHQIKAVRAALKGLEACIVESHMRHCVKQAIASKDAFVVQEKVEEIILLFKGQT